MAQFGVCCLLPFFVYNFSAKGKKYSEATSRVDMGHQLGPKSHVSIATFVRLLLAMTMEIWDCECGAFRPIFPVCAI